MRTGTGKERLDRHTGSERGIHEFAVEQIPHTSEGDELMDWLHRREVSVVDGLFVFDSSRDGEAPF